MRRKHITVFLVAIIILSYILLRGGGEHNVEPDYSVYHDGTLDAGPMPVVDLPHPAEDLGYEAHNDSAEEEHRPDLFQDHIQADDVIQQQQAEDDLHLDLPKAISAADVAKAPEAPVAEEQVPVQSDVPALDAAAPADQPQTPVDAQPAQESAAAPAAPPAGEGAQPDQQAPPPAAVPADAPGQPPAQPDAQAVQPPVQAAQSPSQVVPPPVQADQAPVQSAVVPAQVSDQAAAQPVAQAAQAPVAAVQTPAVQEPAQDVQPAAQPVMPPQ